MTSLILPPTCDRAAVGMIAAELADALAKGAVEIDGTKVATCGQAAIQLLLSAQRTAAAAHVPLRIIPSEAMVTMLRLAGVEAVLLGGAAA